MIHAKSSGPCRRILLDTTAGDRSNNLDAISFAALASIGVAIILFCSGDEHVTCAG